MRACVCWGNKQCRKRGKGGFCFGSLGTSVYVHLYAGDPLDCLARSLGVFGYSGVFFFFFLIH